MRGHLDDPELVISDGGAEFGSQADASASLRIGQEMTDLSDGKGKESPGETSYWRGTPRTGHDPCQPC